MFKKIHEAVQRLMMLDRRIDEIKINQGHLLADINRAKLHTDLCDFEFKVFSQWGEDGILQHLTTHLAISNRTFIEFGVEDFYESNCRFLMMKDNWSGFVIDGSEKNIGRLRSSYFYWRYPLQSIVSFITKENVPALLEESGFSKQVGILSVDVDGIDWHLLEALGDWQPSIVIVEYNSLFGPVHSVTVPYVADFVRARVHWSNLYWGASLPAFVNLMEPRGYSLVGVNSVGSNAFFVRQDLLNKRVPAVTVSDCFKRSTFRETRDAKGRLTYRTAYQSWEVIADLPLLDTLTGSTRSVRSLF